MMIPDEEKTTRGKISTGVVIALIGALSGLIGGVSSSYLNLRTEQGKSTAEALIEQGKSQTQLEVEQQEVKARIDLQNRQAQQQFDLERAKQKATELLQARQAQQQFDLERAKHEATALLARQEFETKLIMQAVTNVTPDVATKNLQFFLQAGFISDPDKKIAQLSVAAPPSIPSPNATGIPLRSPRACTELATQDFRGAAIPMTTKDLQEVANTLGIEPASLRAVIDVETSGHGFLPDGRPGLLYERFIFSRLTSGKFDDSHPDISSPTPGGYGASGTHQYELLKEAMSLDCGAALAASSWGISGLSGSNYQLAGFETVDEFIRTQMTSERKQLDSLAAFLQAQRLVDPLKRKDWASFARGYNGPSFAINHYDHRLASAYEKYQSTAQN